MCINFRLAIRSYLHSITSVAALILNKLLAAKTTSSSNSKSTLIMKVCLVSLLALASSAPQAVGAGHIRRLDKSTSSDKSRRSKGKGCDPTDHGYLIEKALKLEQISETVVREFGQWEPPEPDDKPVEWIESGWKIKVDSTGKIALEATMPGLELNDHDKNGLYDENEVTVSLNAYLGDECVDDYYDEIVSTARFSTGSCEGRCWNNSFECTNDAEDDAAELLCNDELSQCLSECLQGGWIIFGRGRR